MDKKSKDQESMDQKSMDQESMDQLKANIAEEVAEHKNAQKGDGLRFNYGIAFVLFATAMSTLIPTEPTWLLWIAKVLTGFAVFWVALERALNFGARWRFHIEMKSAYQNVLDELNFLPFLDEKQRDETRQDIRAELRLLRKRTSQIPGGRAE